MANITQDSDYEALLQQYSKQVEALKLSEEEKTRASDIYKVEALKLSEEEKTRASDIYKATIKKKGLLLKALNERKKRKSESCATLAQELAKLMQYNQMDDGQLTNLQKIQQERSAMMSGESESMLLDEIHQLSAQYEHLQFEFDDKSLQAEVTRLKEIIKPLTEELHQYKALLNSVKKESLKSESLQEYYHTACLLPLSESINEETSEAFGFSNNAKCLTTELAKKKENIEALKKQVVNLETQ